MTINAGGGGALTDGLHPAIQLLAGDVDPSTDRGDGTIDVATESASSAVTTGTMRAVDGQYIYSLQASSSAAGTTQTIRVRPIGAAGGGALYVLIRAR